jgi:protein-arginine kinase activator protein McsA
MSSSAIQKKTTKTYTYRSGAGGGNTNTDVSIEYSADLSALSRLEVRTIEAKKGNFQEFVKKKSCENCAKKLKKIMKQKMVQCAIKAKKNY